MAIALFQIDPRDSVATALRDMAAGEAALGVTLAVDLPTGHKVAVRAVAAGAPVLKFGFPIGRATQAIAPREHVHPHNVRTALEGSGSDRFALAHEARAPFEGPGFLGYRRAGTRNEIWVIPTVGCVGRTAQKIAERAAHLHEGEVDGVHAFAHPFGCSQLRNDLDGTRAILTALANHPNAGGVLIIGLGWESNQMRQMLEGITHPNIRMLGAQMALWKRGVTL